MNKITMGLHVGKALKYITDNYPTLTKVVLELIQNAFDSSGNQVSVFINYADRELRVRDNGTGISPTKFVGAIQSVCSSIKEVGKLGQFGIGLMSPLGKCERFTITSAPYPLNNGYHRWLFNCQEILSSSELPQIPQEALPEFIFSQALKKIPNKRPVNWRTEVALYKFSKDGSISTINSADLRSLILNQFSEVMKKLDATVTLTIRRGKEKGNDEVVTFKAADFKGEKLDTIIYGDEKTGLTSFNLYLSPKTKKGRQGEIQVGLKFNDFRIPFSVFARSIREWVSDETMNILRSGTFEGAILSSKCSLHQNRKEFHEDENLMTFCMHLDAWAKNYGSRHIIALKDSQKDLWLQAVGSVAMSHLEEQIRQDMPHLMEVIKNFKVGTIGIGHEGFTDKKKEQSFKVVAVKQDLSGTSEREPSTSGSEKTNGKSHLGHTPYGVAGPKGTHRKLVRGHSTGIQFIYEELPGNGNHWEVEADNGNLTFNIRSDVWEKMEQAGERHLILYQQYCAIKALEMLLEPPASRDSLYEFLQRELKTASIFIVSTSFLQPRKAKAEVGKKM